MRYESASEGLWFLRGDPSDTGEAEPLQVPELTRRMGRGDEEAFVEFHGRYFVRMFRYAFVLCGGDEENAKEVTQESLLRVVRYVKPMRDEDVFWSWLTVLMRSAAADQGRRQTRYRRLRERYRLASELSRVAGGERTESGGAIFLLEEALATLDVDDRQLIERKYFRGESYGEMATDLNTTARAIEGRLARARKKLKQAILRRADR